MKLFRAPKNIIGNEKNTDIKNPPFINIYRDYGMYFLSKFSRKLLCVYRPYMHAPINPVNI